MPWAKFTKKILYRGPLVLLNSFWVQDRTKTKIRAVNFMHAILTNRKPHDIAKNLIIPDRLTKDIRYTCKAKFKNMFNGFLKLYNRLPGDLRSLSRKGFKVKSKKCVPKLW